MFCVGFYENEKQETRQDVLKHDIFDFLMNIILLSDIINILNIMWSKMNRSNIKNPEPVSNNLHRDLKVITCKSALWPVSITFHPCCTCFNSSYFLLFLSFGLEFN